MIEEPYRWVEAIANRREYIETQLAAGRPIAALGYRDGILFLTLGRTRQKIFEIYDRVAMGAIGHPGDIERLRMAAIELASTEGFTRSAAAGSSAAASISCNARKVYASQSLRILISSMLPMFITSRQGSDFRHPRPPGVLGFLIGTNHPASAGRTWEEGFISLCHLPLTMTGDSENLCQRP